MSRLTIVAGGAIFVACISIALVADFIAFGSQTP